jgi:hypothetical protein
MNQDPAILTEKIRTLSPEQLSEVDDFVEFLRLRAEERGLAGTAASASAKTFETVWSNPEDDAYDAIFRSGSGL